MAVERDRAIAPSRRARTVCRDGRGDFWSAADALCALVVTAWAIGHWVGTMWVTCSRLVLSWGLACPLRSAPELSGRLDRGASIFTSGV